MNKLRDPHDPSSIDLALAKALRGRYGQLTRRSFLSGVTRRMMALSGVTLAAQVFPYFVPEAHATGVGVMCGNHGYYCGTGNCTIGGDAAPKNWWKACCSIQVTAPPCPTVYMCITYTDYCGTQPTGWPDHCGGVRSGTDWCSGMGDYICTTTTPGPSYSTPDDCTNNCLGAHC